MALVVELPRTHRTHPGSPPSGVYQGYRPGWVGEGRVLAGGIVAWAKVGLGSDRDRRLLDQTGSERKDRELNAI